MRFFLLSFFLGIFFRLPAQEIIRPTNDKDSVYTQEAVQETAEYPGGMDALTNFLATHIKYPIDARDKEIQGKVYVEFIISRRGKVTNIKIRKGAYPSLDKEAMRVISKFPDWKPALVDGKKVRQKYILPINFKITKQD